MSCCLLLTFGPRLRRLHGALLGSEYSALPEDGGGERGCEERGVESQPCCVSGRRQLVSSFPLPLLHSAAVRLGLTGSERTPLPPHVTPLCECGTFRIWNAGCNPSFIPFHVVSLFVSMRRHRDVLSAAVRHAALQSSVRASRRHRRVISCVLCDLIPPSCWWVCRRVS